jgi:5-methylcytosine-specific restriction endonuclease McrA
MEPTPHFDLSRFSHHRFLHASDLPKVEKRHCRWCNKPVPGARRNWCSQECVDAYMLRSNAGTVRAAVRKRDKGICDQCGLDTYQIRHEVREYRELLQQHGLIAGLEQPKWEERRTYWSNGWGTAWRAAMGPWHDYTKSLWEADHIIPVIEGGGCCPISNYRTLCVRCHKLETKALAGRRAVRRKANNANNSGL